MNNVKNKLEKFCDDFSNNVKKHYVRNAGSIKSIGLMSALVISYGIGEYHGAKSRTATFDAKDEKIMELVNYHSNFVRQLPNYDGTAAFIFGSPVENGRVITYEDWLLQDIRDHYRK